MSEKQCGKSLAVGAVKMWRRLDILLFMWGHIGQVNLSSTDIIGESILGRLVQFNFANVYRWKVFGKIW